MYRITSVKATAAFKSTTYATLADAVAVAESHAAEYAPAYGVQVEDADGVTVWDSEDAE